MSQNDTYNGNTFAVGNDEDSMEFGKELLDIDVDALVTTRDTERVDQVKEQLEEIVSTLANCHVVTSLSLTTDQSKRFLLS